MPTAYDDDLAFVHDVGFSELARLAAGLALELLAEAPPGPVVELGCGGGVTARALVEGGRPVHGIDISAAQVALARERVPEARFEVGSFVDAELPAGCAAVIAVGEVFNYRFDERAGPRALADLFARAREALVAGGLLLFDSAGPGRVPDGSRRSFAEGEDWAILHQARERREPPELERAITTFRRIDGIWRRTREIHRLALLEPEAVAALLRSAGFEPEVRPGYDGRRFAPGHDVFVGHRA